jgi:hypothetical protein
MDILAENSSKGEVGTGMDGSHIHFVAALMPIGLPWGKKDWMNDDYPQL